MNELIAMDLKNNELESSVQLIQTIVSLRPKNPVIPEIIRLKIKSIEHLLSERDGFNDWRRGTTQSSGTSNGRYEPNLKLQVKWKGGHTSEVPKSDRGSSVPAGKYQSKFKNSSSPVEDTILNTIILNKLNKFSQSTYKEIKEFLYQILDSGQVDFIKDFMNLVFKKAASEEIFCGLYLNAPSGGLQFSNFARSGYAPQQGNLVGSLIPNLLSELRVTYPVITKEMEQLFESYLIIFEEIDESKNDDYKLFVERNIEKKYRLGYSQFLAELTMLEAVDLESLKKTFKILIENIETLGKTSLRANEIQESCDCLLRMSRVLDKRNGIFFIKTRKMLYEMIKEDLEQILNSDKSAYSGITPKARFALMDIQDILKK